MVFKHSILVTPGQDDIDKVSNTYHKTLDENGLRFVAQYIIEYDSCKEQLIHINAIVETNPNISEKGDVISNIVAGVYFCDFVTTELDVIPVVVTEHGDA